MQDTSKGQVLGGRLNMQRSGLDDLIYTRLRGRIVSLALKPGTMIYENAVAEEFGISRTPVRQAFSRLAREDLLKILPQRGAKIPHLSVAKVREAQFVREALEVAAFTELARIWDPKGRHAAVRTEALALIEQQRAAVARGDNMAFTELDVRFHNVLIGALGNATLLAMLDQARLHLTRLRYLELQEAHHEAEALADHETLMQALDAHDPDETGRRLIAHLKRLEGQREEMFGRHPELFELRGPAP